MVLREELRGERGGSKVFKLPADPKMGSERGGGGGGSSSGQGRGGGGGGRDDPAPKKSRVTVLPAQAMRSKLPLQKRKATDVLDVVEKRDRKKEGTHKDPLCCRCGRRKTSDPVAKAKHSNRVSKTSAAFCRVAEELYLPGYPKRGYASV